jgi:proline iminopeptidase
MVFYHRHLCRSESAWEVLGPIFEDLNMQVYGSMWGPSEFFATGSLKDYDRSGSLGEISVPTLFTAGRFDEATPETTAWYQSLVPGASLAIFEESAHMTMLEEPESYAQVVREFLHRVESGE